MQVFKAMKEMDDGQILEVTATDPGFSKDIKAWCNKTGNTLLQSTFEGKSFKYLIKKGTDKQKHFGTYFNNSSILHNIFY